jgi:hypothetical protein
MQVEVPPEGSTEDHEKVQIPRDRPLGVIHSGNRYAFGFGSDLYGIWDSASSGPPVEQFPPTDDGRQAGWRRYLELEPSASGTVITTASPDEVWRREVEEKRKRSRRRSLITIAVLILGGVGAGVALAVSTGSGNQAATGVLSEAAKAKKAHIEISGSATATEDLTQTEFNSTPIGSLIGSSVKGVWKGATVLLTIDVHNPSVGTFTTTVITNKEVEIALPQPDGTTATLRSTQGECKITVDAVVEDGFSGTFECTGLSLPGGAGTIDAKGNYGASK